jgi:hypothetical protein
MYLSPVFRSVQAQHQTKLCSKCNVSLVSFLNFKSCLLVKRICLLNVAFAT